VRQGTCLEFIAAKQVAEVLHKQEMVSQCLP
jgi:hypothetical protein